MTEKECQDTRPLAPPRDMPQTANLKGQGMGKHRLFRTLVNGKMAAVVILVCHTRNQERHSGKVAGNY